VPGHSYRQRRAWAHGGRDASAPVARALAGILRAAPHPVNGKDGC